MEIAFRFFSKAWAWVKTIPTHIWLIIISGAAWFSYQRALRWKKRAQIERERVDVERAYREALEQIENTRQEQRTMVFDEHGQELARIKKKEKVLSDVALDKKKLTDHLNSVFGEDE